MEGIQTAAFLRALVNKYLTGNVLDSARFYAERLYYESPSADSLYLLALCYFRTGKYKQTFLILQDCIHNPTAGAPLNKYLFALACNELDRLEEGERALSPHKHKTVDSITLEAVSATPGGAEGVYLLGKLCRRQHRKEMAIMYYKLSLKMDPYLWSAITELSEMGVAINVKELYAGYADRSENASSRSIFDDAKNSEESRPFQARPPGALEEKAGWLSDVKQASTERYYSNGGVFCDSKAGNSDKLQRYSTAELLSSGGGYGYGDQHGASPKVSMSIGMSSMSLHVPFASPASMPSPTPGGMSMGMMNPYTASQMKPRKALAPASAGGGPVLSEDSNYSSSEPFDMTMTMNMSDSGDSSRFYARNRSDSYDQDAESDNRHLQGARTALFGMGTPGLTPISNANNETGITPAMRNLNTTNARSALHTGASTGNVNGVVGVDLFGSSAPNTNQASGSVGPGAGAGGSRRVSFGPTARLSFSGALDGAAMGAQSAHLRQLHGDDSSFGQSGLLTSVDMEDDYPYKLPRQNELDGSTSPAQTSAHRTAEDSNRALPRKLLLSPFPTESSPILPQLGAVQPSADGLPSPTFRRKLGARHSTGGQHAGSGTAGIALSSESASTSQASNGEEVDKENGSNENPRHVHYHHPPAHAPHEHFAHSRTLAPTPAVDRLVATLARAYQMLCLYCCRACIDELHSLPERHYRSALVSQWIGKAYYEMNEYKPAMLAFREMLRAEPFRLCGLETLSTALWHLKRDKELCTLAQQVVEVDKLSPEAWCVVGNCFSLQREPDTAIKFFQRAIQLDPTFTYAYTLSGHELVNNEDLEKAVESFRQALLYNDRHYNAWYGLGSIYYRQEKFELAEYHFRKALSINPASSVLHCYLGMALHAQNNQMKSSEALDILTAATQKDTTNPQLHFQRAHILVAVGNLPEALEALLVVEEHAPKESPVHALLGQVYHRLGELGLAIRHLNIAMDLDPKETASLRVILEHIDEPPLDGN